MNFHPTFHRREKDLKCRSGILSPMWFGDENFTREKALQILVDEFDRRKTRNPYYSLRAYARDLDVDHSSLAKIFRGERQISWEIGRQVQKHLLKS